MNSFLTGWCYMAGNIWSTYGRYLVPCEHSALCKACRRKFSEIGCGMKSLAAPHYIEQIFDFGSLTLELNYTYDQLKTKISFSVSHSPRPGLSRTTTSLTTPLVFHPTTLSPTTFLRFFQYVLNSLRARG